MSTKIEPEVVANELIELAEKQKEQTLVAVVDCSDNSVLCKYWNVTEVPTLFL